MEQSNTPRVTKQAALAAVDALVRPEGMSRQTWAGVHKVLRGIATCYPKAWPSQMRLAARLDMNERTLQRYIAAAVDAGLLLVKANAGAAPRRAHGARTNSYLLCFQHDKLSYQVNTYYVGVQRGTSSLKTSSSETRHPDPPPAGQSQTHPQGPTVDRMDDWADGDGARDVTPPKPPPLRARKTLTADEVIERHDSGRRQPKRTPKPPPRWMRLTEHFVHAWEAMAQETGRYKDTRALESFGQAKVYLMKHFSERSELEVRTMIDEFIAAVRKRDITVKQGQSAWMCFTGAGGRQRHVVIGDPYAAYRKKKS